MITSLLQISPAQLRRAANVKEQIVKLEKELGAILGSSPATTPTKGPKKMSAAARARISAAAKARWAKIKGTAKPAVQPKQMMSAAARAKLSAKLKAIWAKRKAGKKTAKPAAQSKQMMSAAARAKLSAKMKAIWAKRKAGRK